ncbi:MAG: aspartyl-phosphate phosphatase Spo0E family protein [Pelosinus sp.]|nr:aspartyl-phosphate phosphatase Spo0E family protein [Pelosinus sp.]
MAELDDVLKSIEDLRHKLNRLYEQKGTIDKEVIKLSKMLDAMLNEYEQLIKK